MEQNNRATSRELRLASFTSGIAGAGLALGVAEIGAALFNSVTSPVIAVGDFMVDTTPGAIARFTIDLFGTRQKTILVWGITIVVLVLGGVLGSIALRRLKDNPTRGKSFIAAVYAGFAFVGALAMGREPGASWIASVAVIAVAAAAGAGATIWLFSRLHAESAAATEGDEDAPVPLGPGRRSFVASVVTVMVGAIATGWIGRALGARNNVDAARAEAASRLNVQSSATPVSDGDAPALDAEVPDQLQIPVGLEAEVEGLSPLIVPNEDYYRIDTALRSPQVDPADWELRITGMVDNEVTYTYDDLLQRATLEVPVTLSCVSNEVGGKLVGNAIWRGVPLRDLLSEAGVQPSAEQIIGRSVDDWTGGFPIAHLDDPKIDALVAVAMNGEPLPVSHGFPARLVIAGLYGYVSATKWLAEIELTTWDDVDGYWIPRGWSKTGPIKTQSRIDVPLQSDRNELTAGEIAVAGVAWAPGRGIEKVEIQVDDDEWVEADLRPASSVNEWQQWLYRWTASAGEHRLRVRATDGTGETQTEQVAPPAPDGATGYHAISVTVN